VSKAKQRRAAVTQAIQLENELSCRLYNFDAVINRMRQARPENGLPGPLVAELASHITDVQECLQRVKEWLWSNEDSQYNLPLEHWLTAEPSFDDVPF
jgi:hypothetical protein